MAAFRISGLFLPWSAKQLAAKKPLADLVDPLLTDVSQPIAEIGEKNADLLI